MELLQDAFSFLIHIDKYLAELIDKYGAATYVILFVIIFCETGLVVTPFLPGDSLLFAAGALAAEGSINLGLLAVLLIAAAVIGDSTNYWIGSKVGPGIFKPDARILKTSHLRRTEDFYRQYGGKAIVIARFAPIVRTYAPFVAGVVRMQYRRFLAFNVIGGVVWIVGFLVAGYLFGAIPIVRDNFALVIIAVVLLSVLPVVAEVLRRRRRERDDELSQGSDLRHDGEASEGTRRS